jgi:hypothetical protein
MYSETKFQDPTSDYASFVLAFLSCYHCCVGLPSLTCNKIITL